MTQPKTVSYETLLAEEMARDPGFREEWEQTALARLVAVQLDRVPRGEQALAAPRLEDGETNPDLETLVYISRVLGTEFVIAAAG
jgi:hypothetical protein